MERKSSSRKKIVMDSGVPYLPQEIITNILTRLHVKSLIRLQCVCKDWKNMFKTPSFIAEHLLRSTQQPCLLFMRINPQRLCLMTPDMQEHEYQISPFTASSMCSFLPSSSNNGLICLQLRKSKSWCLWNPALREVHEVFKPLHPDRAAFSFLGFGFSPIVNDYKIVRIISPMNADVTYKVEVFSLCTRSWKYFKVGKLGHIMDGMNSYGFPFDGANGFTFDGAIYWFSKKPDVGKDGYSVVSFDIATEEFTFIPFPRSSNRSISYSYKLTSYESKLAVISYHPNKYLEPYSHSIDLWVMDKCIDASKETCIWTKIYTSKRYSRLLLPVTIWRNEIVCKVNEMYASMRGTKVVLENEDEARLVFCNIRTNEFKEFGICSFTTPIWSYADSFISDLAEIDLRRYGIGGPTQKYDLLAPRRSLRLKKRAFKLLGWDDL